jgi:adenylate cyclase
VQDVGARHAVPPQHDDLAAALHALTAAEFVYEQELFPVAVYAFKHPLTQEVAHSSQLQERRRGTHAAVARAIQDAHAGKLDEQAALLAHHWEEAGQPLEAAGWHGRAAGWAGTSDIAAALRHWQRVPALLREAPETAETMRLGVEARFHALRLAWWLGLPEAEIEAMAAEGKTLAARSGDPGLLALIVGAHGAVRGFAGATTQYLEASREAMRLAQQADDPRVISYARIEACWSSWYAGRLADALAFADEELRELAAHPYSGPGLSMGTDPMAVAIAVRGAVIKYMGRLDEAAHEQARAEALARAQRDQATLFLTLVEQAWNKCLRGEDDALRLSQASVEAAQRIGDPLLRAEALWILGMCHLGSTRWEEARRALESALSIMHAARVDLVVEPRLRSDLASACAGLGDFDRARQLAREGSDLLLARGTLMHAVPAFLNLAHVLRLADGAAAAGEIGATLDRAFALIGETGAEVYRPQAHVERAELERLLGDEAAYQRDLREAHRLFTEMGATGHAKRVAGMIGDAPGSGVGGQGTGK